MESLNTTKRIQWVLTQFKSMGATRDDLNQERIKLMTDDEYYKKWCVDESWIGSSSESQFYIEAITSDKKNETNA